MPCTFIAYFWLWAILLWRSHKQFSCFVWHFKQTDLMLALHLYISNICHSYTNEDRNLQIDQDIWNCLVFEPWSSWNLLMTNRLVKQRLDLIGWYHYHSSFWRDFWYQTKLTTADYCVLLEILPCSSANAMKTRRADLTLSLAPVRFHPILKFKIKHSSLWVAKLWFKEHKIL